MQSVGIREKIIEEIRKMGFSFKHMGTIYLIETIEMVYNSKDTKIINNIEENIYKKIAEKYSKNTKTVKSDVTKATDYMYSQYLLEIKKTDKNYRLYPKLTPKSVINTVILKLSA